ncbi:MAG: hypothetical protein KGI41_02250 [Patescibacteria group bacterium]|nr:hypothetical protein [Patescibacteria group bacterium]MDE1966035.1 hypothetical protein [Patescibacteria group bacterium]
MPAPIDPRLESVARKTGISVPKWEAMLRSATETVCTAQTIDGARRYFDRAAADTPAQYAGRECVKTLALRIAETCRNFGELLDAFHYADGASHEGAVAIAKRLIASASDTSQAATACTALRAHFAETELQADAIARWNELSSIEANAAKTFNDALAAYEAALSGSAGERIARERMAAFAGTPEELRMTLCRTHPGSDEEFTVARRLWKMIPA